MYSLARALLFLLSAERAHRLVMWLLHVLSGMPGVCAWLRRRQLRGFHGTPVEIAGLRFEHPIALAAGLDKDAEAVSGLFAMGFSAVEIGTVTPRAQPGNPKPRVFRLPGARALINRMGFNNHGAEAAAVMLRATAFRPGPVGVNLGKNKDTPLEDALADYQAAARVLAPLGDYVVINASSPNTPGLRQLQEPERLKALLDGVRETLEQVAPGKPLFLKVSPDLAPEDVEPLVEVAVAARVQGLIASNTTLDRPADVTDPAVKESGGLSGSPLRERSTALLRRISAAAKGRLALIASGGVMDVSDVEEKLQAGAQLVQVYTGFVYGGAGWVKRLVEALKRSKPSP